MIKFTENLRDLFLALTSPNVGYSESCANRIIKNKTYILFTDMNELHDYFNQPDAFTGDPVNYAPIEYIDYDIITLSGVKYYIVCDL